MKRQAFALSVSLPPQPVTPLGESNAYNYKKRGRNMKAFITVIGHDTVGVVMISGLCCELNINIEDVTQSILQGMFAMIMLLDISKCSISHEELHQKMDALAAEMGMQINLTRQEVFDAMHTI